MQNQIEQYKMWLNKALAHLEYSFYKLQGTTPDVAGMSEETLESWEGPARAGRSFFLAAAWTLH